jgi:uncharacterized membrane protein
MELDSRNFVALLIISRLIAVWYVFYNYALIICMGIYNTLNQMIDGSK